MSGLLIAGAGGHGKVVAEVADMLGLWERIAFLDDRNIPLRGDSRHRVVGTIDKAANFRTDFQDVVVAVGDADTRLRLLEMFSGMGYRLPSLIHPAAWVSSSVKLGEGSVVFASAAVCTDARIGRGVIINTGATVDHDCILGDGVHVCPGANLAGQVTVGRGSWIGIGSCVIQQVCIGENAMIGAGSVVLENVMDGVTAVGVPAKVIRTHG